MRKYIGSVRLFLLVACAAFAQSTLPTTTIGGKYVASQYGGWSVQSVNSVAAGAASMTLSNCYPKMGNGIAGPNGGLQIRPLFVFATNTPVTVVDGSLTETVTPSAVTAPTANTASSINPFNCSFTATFSNAHTGGVTIVSGDGGLAEAVNDAHATGGVVVLDPLSGISDSNITSNTAVFHNVVLEDDRQGAVTYWNSSPSTATFLAVPTTLTAVTALPSATPVGAYGTGTYHLCIAYVDIMGNEGACSLDFSEAGLATGSFIFTAPAASTGAVGYTIYISLTAGTYALAYQVPLTSSICTLTTVETVTPACAVANTNYAQTGATATVTAITVNTSPIALQLGVASTTSDYVGDSNGRTTYAYVRGARVGPSGLVVVSPAFTAGPATVATTVPQVIGTVSIPAGLMNQLGRTLRVCGKVQMTGASATIEQIQLWWDGAGSNAAGVPVKIANLQAAAGPNTAAAYNGNFCANITTTVAGAAVTAGSIIGGETFWNYYLASAPVAIFGGGDTFTATTALLNLAGGAGFTTRLHIVQLHTTGTDVSPQLVHLTVELL